MKIERDKVYVCKKDLHSNIGPDHMAFLKGKDYTAWKNNALTGEDGISYALPEHSLLANYFDLKAL